MEIAGHCSFTLTHGNDKRNGLPRLKNSVTQGSVLESLLFIVLQCPIHWSSHVLQCQIHQPPNGLHGVTVLDDETIEWLINTCLYDMASTVSRKYAYADDLAIMYADGDWQAVEGVLTKDMRTVCEYLQTWKVKLSTTKTVRAAFHLNNKEAKRELKVNYNNEILTFYPETKHLGVTLDMSLTGRRRLEFLRKNLTSRVALLRRLAGSSWGAGKTTLRTATTLALVHSTAEHCAPVGTAVLIPASLTPPSTTPCELWLDACVLHQRMTFPTSQASNILIFVEKESYSLQHAGPWSLDTYSTQHSSVHPE